MTMEMEIAEDHPDEIPEQLKATSINTPVKSTLDYFTDNGGLYDLTIKQMLQPGHEGELCGWLKEINLLRSSMACPSPECFGKMLIWSPTRTVDKYCWLCTECKKKQSIRDGSFFLQIKCDLKICMQIIIAWCQLLSNEVVVNYLGIKPFVVKKVYEKLDKVAESYVSKHREDWILGGRGKIVIVDEFPGGYMTEAGVNAPVIKKRNNNCHTILCMAEVDFSNVPPRMWMHIINAHPEPSKSKNPNPETKCGMVEEALNVICNQVRHGTDLVASKRARCCNYESLKELKEYRVICIDDLRAYDTPGKNELLSNLETIWQTGIGVCEDIQEMSQTNGLTHLYVHFWRQKFATTSATAIGNIMQHIAESYLFT